MKITSRSEQIILLIAGTISVVKVTEGAEFPVPPIVMVIRLDSYKVEVGVQLTLLTVEVTNLL